MKKHLSLFLMLFFLVSAIAGCAKTESPAKENKKLSIVTTIFPQYDWVNQILGENRKNAEVTLLINNGVDMHSYQPTVEDAVRIKECDLFIYTGGESEEWVEDILQDSSNVLALNLMQSLGERTKEEEIIEGMEEHDHEHKHDDEENYDHEEDDDHDEEHDGAELDEHVWLSLQNAQILCGKIADAITLIDGDNASLYEKNVMEYINQLNELDAQYAKAVSESKHRTIIVGDRFPFRYLVDDYGIDYYAAFPGCSAESEASFETVKFLADKYDEMNLPAVITLESGDHGIAKAIVNNAKNPSKKLITLNSLQSVVVTENSPKHNFYIEAMKSNLNLLKSALN